MTTKTAEKPAQVKSEMRNVKLSDIAVADNYRTQYDEESMKELTSSVYKDGVLQPILLCYTTTKGQYGLVAGRRRYMAAMNVKTLIKSRDEIPAIIREMTHEEVLEYQIIENLQRKDVHPMDEAAGFKRIMEQRNWPVTELAIRVGKTPVYVAQRLKLNDIIPEYQKAFFEDRVSLREVKKLFRLSAESQKELYDNEGHETESEITFSDWDIKRYLCNLSDAPFDITDVSIDSKMGACENCQFNSQANVLLFPDEKGAKCSLASCFKNKAQISFTREFERAKEDPSIVFVTNQYGKPEDGEVQKLGVKIYDRNSYSIEYKPEAPDLDDFDEDEYDSAEEREAAIKEAQAEYEKDLTTYDKKIASGKYLKALVIYGNDKGKYIHIQLNKSGANATKPSAAVIKSKQAEGTVTAEDLKSEIARIETNAKRKAELTEEAMVDPIYNYLVKDPNFKGSTKPLKNEEIIATILFLYTKSRSNANAEFKKITNYKGSDYRHHALYRHLKANTKLLPVWLNAMARLAFAFEFSPSKNDSAQTHASAAIMQDVASAYNADQVKKIRKEHETILATYNEKVLQKVTVLKAKMKALIPEKTAPKKSASPSKKKAAKKNVKAKK